MALYFVAAAASLPLWSIVSNRIGKLRAWAVAMVLAILVFVWAAELGAGDLIAYAVICMLSGIALGADLSLPSQLIQTQTAKNWRGKTDAVKDRLVVFGIGA